MTTSKQLPSMRLISLQELERTLCEPEPESFMCIWICKNRQRCDKPVRRFDELEAVSRIFTLGRPPSREELEEVGNFLICERHDDAKGREHVFENHWRHERSDIFKKFASPESKAGQKRNARDRSKSTASATPTRPRINTASRTIKSDSRIIQSHESRQVEQSPPSPSLGSSMLLHTLDRDLAIVSECNTRDKTPSRPPHCTRLDISSQGQRLSQPASPTDEVFSPTPQRLAADPFGHLRDAIVGYPTTTGSPTQIDIPDIPSQPSRSGTQTREIDLEGFVKGDGYSMSPAQIRVEVCNLLREDEPGPTDRHRLYVFTDSTGRYVKIGITHRSLKTRMSEIARQSGRKFKEGRKDIWQSPRPLSHTKALRLEKTVQLYLLHYQRDLPCHPSRTQTEWFEMSFGTAVKVCEFWNEVLTKPYRLLEDREDDFRRVLTSSPTSTVHGQHERHMRAWRDSLECSRWSALYLRLVQQTLVPLLRGFCPILLLYLADGHTLSASLGALILASLWTDHVTGGTLRQLLSSS